jgi:hypothetical protein
MKFVCMEDCYFMSNLFKRGEGVEGHQFASNRHFKPMDKEAVDEIQALGREAELPEQEDAFVPDPELMKKSVMQLRSLYPGVEWRANMRKPEFVKSIMESTNGQ